MGDATEEAEGTLGELQDQIKAAKEAASQLEEESKPLQADVKAKKAEIEEAKASEKSLKEQLAEEEKNLKKLKKELTAVEERTAKAKKEEEEARANAEAALAALEEVATTDVEATLDTGESMAPGQQSMDAGEKKEGDAMTPNGSSWSTGLCSCCVMPGSTYTTTFPGGCTLCLKTCLCPCWILGDINNFNKEKEKASCPGGCCGGCCLGCLCTPCFMCRAAPTVAEFAGFQEGKCKACMCTCCCPQCYIGRVHRETLIIKISEGGGSSVTPVRWSTGLCQCCAQPGGCGVCCKAFVVPCMLCGGINRFLKENEAPACAGGCPGGCCLGCCCTPCFLCKTAPAVAEKAGKTEGKCRSFCTACFCPCCYTMQVQRETLLCSTA